MPNRPVLIHPSIPLAEACADAAVPGLRGLQRAVQADAKEQRRARILDAAAEVLRASPQRDVAVADVAQAAGLAKGTVYLYFPSKDELLLALHERETEGFFEALRAASSGHRLNFEGIFALLDRHVLSAPIYLPLASRCLGGLDFAVLPAVRQAYRDRMRRHLGSAGQILEQHFEDLEAGGGMSLLMACYAQIMGLWQLLSPERAHPYPLEFRHEVERALRALWQGRVAAEPG